MSRRNLSSSDPFALIGFGCLVYGCYQAYVSLSAAADSLGITLFALACIIGGVLFDVVLACWCIFFDGNKARVLPWILPVTFASVSPALTCLARRRASFNLLAYVQDTDPPEIEWWGSQGFEFLVFIALCGVAYALMRKFDYSYRWR